MAVSNQEIIQEFVYEPCNKNNLYATINLEALQHAMKDLGGGANALKLWLYLSKNSTNFRHLELSRKDCCSWGMGSSQFTDAKNLLVKKGYLVARNKGHTIFDFIQYPGKEPITETEMEVKISETVKEDSTDNKKMPETVKETPTGHDNFSESEKVSTESAISISESIREILQDYIYNTSLTFAQVQKLKDKDDICVDYEDDNHVYVTLDGKRKLKLNK